jgi:L-ascorbate metabolism protein UlaG (beta-lactamase superfamily)
MNVKWLGHSVFLFEIENTKILIDPFIKNNTKYNLSLNDIGTIDYILLTHGHPDHIGDTIELLGLNIVNKVIASFEITQWLMQQGIDDNKIIDMNIGGMIKLNNNIEIHMVQAVHSNSIIDNGNIVYGGYPSGFIIKTPKNTIYYSGDTGVFSDMKLIQDMYSPNIAMLPV